MLASPDIQRQADLGHLASERLSYQCFESGYGVANLILERAFAPLDGLLSSQDLGGCQFALIF